MLVFLLSAVTIACAGSIRTRHLARCLIYLGDLSYPLYILQIPVLLFLIPALAHHARAAIPAGIVACLIAAIASYHLIDAPLRKSRRVRKPPLLA
jgi:peptidoglycan/LPS O-acetylase OafA/YrhL